MRWFFPLEGGGGGSFQHQENRPAIFTWKIQVNQLPSQVLSPFFLFVCFAFRRLRRKHGNCPCWIRKGLAARRLPNTYVVRTKKTSCQAEPPQRLPSGHSNPGHCCFFKSHVECVPKDQEGAFSLLTPDPGKGWGRVERVTGRRESTRRI